MSAIKIIAPLEPVPFKRVMANGKRRFNNLRYSEFKDELGFFAKIEMDSHGLNPFQGSLKLHADFYKRKPRNPTAKNFGDVDNFLKAVLDALNGICYVDDRQVVQVSGTKFFGEPNIVITLEELK